MDADFTDIDAIKAVSLTGASNITVDGTAQTTGVETIYGGSGASTYTQGAGFTNDLTLLGGVAGDVFTVQTASQLANDSIVGGGGTDTLVVATAQTVVDADFTDIDAIKAVSLTGASNISVGTNAQSAGVSSIYGGASTSSIDGSSYTNGLFIVGKSAADTILGGLVNDTITGGGGADSILAGNGNDLLNFASGTDLGSVATLFGGAGTNTLAFTSGTSVTDANFTKALNIQKVNFSAASSIAVDALAQTAGLQQVIGSNGNDIFTQGTGFTNGLTLDGGNGTDSFIINTTAQVAADSIIGGAGNDTLTISMAGTLLDVSLVNASVDTIQLTGVSNAVLGYNASNNGITAIYSGAGNSSLNGSAMTIAFGAYGQSSYEDTLIGGSNGDTLQGWDGTPTSNTVGDNLTGGAGEDTFVLGNNTSNAYGYGAVSPTATVADFEVGIDRFQLHNYGSGASDYTVNSANPANTLILHNGDQVATVNVSFGAAANILNNALFV